MRGLEDLSRRMTYLGKVSDDRNVNGKLKSMHSALKNSYQAEWIILNEKTDYEKKVRCLINPDKLKDDYDKKIISIDFEHGVKEGQVFYWPRTNTRWMILLQNYEEEAYFRGNIQRCDYEVNVNDNKYWVYLRGPVETTMQWRQKHQDEKNDLNYSLLMYITKNEETLEYFTRHRIFKFEGHRWQVAATDKYGQPGYIQVYLDEYYDNEMEDQMIVPEIKTFEKDEKYIDGPQEVDIYSQKNKYFIKNATDGKFVVNSDKVKITKSDKDSCVIEVLTSKADKFILTYQRDGEEDINLEVRIKSF